MKTEKLLRMKEKIEESDLDIAKLQGKLEDREKQLKKKSGKNNTLKARVILKKLKDKLESKKSELEKGIIELGENYEW